MLKILGSNFSCLDLVSVTRLVPTVGMEATMFFRPKAAMPARRREGGNEKKKHMRKVV